MTALSTSARRSYRLTIDRETSKLNLQIKVEKIDLTERAST